jgi:hypothetical protein
MRKATAFGPHPAMFSVLPAEPLVFSGFASLLARSLSLPLPTPEATFFTMRAAT